MRGLSLDQAPPLGVVLPFFIAASFFATAAGVLLAARGATALSTPWMPETLAVTHLATLGFLMMVMMGAVYQMIPVVIGARVPGIRLAHVVFGAMVVGVSFLVAGLTLSSAWLVEGGSWLLGSALVAFLLPTGWAAFRAPAKTPTANGIRFALLCLFGVGLLGLAMARGHAGGSFPGDRWLFIRVHLTLGLLGWVGSLIVAVSWQVVPMFYLGREVPSWQQRSIFGALVLGTVAAPIGLALDPELADAYVVWSASPAVLALFVAHPAVTLWSIRHRRRKRAHPSLLFWRAGLSMAPVTGISAVLSITSGEPRWDLLYGFLAVWGWAAVILHGMLTRIVPFLVWFHRFSPLAGVVPIPSMNALLPTRWTRVGLALHGSSVLVGAGGIALGSDAILRCAGVLIALTGLALGAMIVHVVMQHPEGAPGAGHAAGSGASPST